MRKLSLTQKAHNSCRQGTIWGQWPSGLCDAGTGNVPCYPPLGPCRCLRFCCRCQFLNKIFPSNWLSADRGLPRGDAQNAPASPSPHPLCIPPRPCASPPSPAWKAGYEKIWGNGPKHNYKLDNNLLTVEHRAVDPHCFDADPEPDPDPAQSLLETKVN